MGLKTPNQNTEDAPAAAKPAAAKPATPKPATPKPAAAKPAAAKPAAAPEGRDIMVRSAGYPHSDPYTGVKYSQNVAKPGLRKEGNWLDCQIKAGVLVECPPEGEKE